MLFPALLLSLAALQEPEQATRERIDRLVRDLGSSDEEARTKADRELRTIGRDALPELKEASRSRDAEQAIRARAILIAIRSQDHPPKGETPAHVKRSVTYHDWANGVFFHYGPDGKVVLRAPALNEKTGRREYKTWRADSLDEFRKKHPEVVKQYDIDQFLSPSSIGGDDAQWWAELEEWLGPSGIPGEWPGIGARGTERADRRGQDPRRRRPRDDKEGEGEGPRLGVHLAPVPQPMRERFGLKEQEGLLVRAVDPGSIAQTAGVKANDILTKVDGKPAKNLEQVRNDLRAGIAAGREFPIEVLREGEPKILPVRPEAK